MSIGENMWILSKPGLCNSARIDKLLEAYHARLRARYGHRLGNNLVRTDCDVCREQAQKMSLNVRLADKQDVIDRALQLCGQLGAYTDACRMEVIDNFDDIYSWVMLFLSCGFCVQLC